MGGSVGAIGKATASPEVVGNAEAFRQDKLVAVIEVGVDLAATVSPGDVHFGTTVTRKLWSLDLSFSGSAPVRGGGYQQAD